MKVIFLATPQLAVPVLEHIHHSSHEIVLVVTQPDRPKGRGLKVFAPPIKVAAEVLGLPVFQPLDVKGEDLHRVIRDANADVMVVLAYSILPDNLFSLTTYGAVNIHGSLLPQYRGAAPVQWAIANGEKISGVTVFQLDGKMDHGKILGQTPVPIGPDVNAEEYLAEIMEAGKRLVLDVLNQMETNSLKPIEQEHEKSSPARKLNKEDGCIDWNKTAAEVHNRIRGFSMFPVCYTTLGPYENQILRIRKSKLVERLDVKSGDFTIDMDGFPIIACGQGALKLLEVQLQGKPFVSGKDFVNGIQGIKAWKSIL